MFKIFKKKAKDEKINKDRIIRATMTKAERDACAEWHNYNRSVKGLN